MDNMDYQYKTILATKQFMQIYYLNELINLIYKLSFTAPTLQFLGQLYESEHDKTNQNTCTPS